MARPEQDQGAGIRSCWLRSLEVLGLVLAVVLPLSASGSSASAAARPPRRAKVTKAATVKGASSRYGKVLVTSSGNVLYGLTANSGTHDACSGPCLAIWPPLTVTKAPLAGPGVDRSRLSTLKLSNGRRQVEYNHHLLFTFSGDSAAGQTKGQGLAFPAGSSSPKGHWWVVSTKGSYVSKATKTSKKASKSSTSRAPTTPTTATTYGGY